MTLQQRPYSGERDWPAIAELIDSDPRFYHRVDFPWRLCSTSLENPRNVALWEDEKGQLQIFVALQFPWLTIDCAIRPESRTRERELQAIQWAETRLREIAIEQGEGFPFNLDAYAEEHERQAFLEELGYARWDSFMVVQSRPLELAILPQPEVPLGFTIRPLAGEREVEAYAALQRAAFDSMTMTAVWRKHTLHAPYYNPDLDLVAVAPDGRLAGFCIWWFHPKLKTAQIEPLGVHPEFQQLGLSRALMAEGMRRVAALGAETAQVETYSFSEPALKAYEAAGFRVVTQGLKYYKEY